MYPDLKISRITSNEVYCYCSRPAGYTPAQFHPYLELYLVESGAVDARINQKRRILRAGDMVLLMSFDTHQYEPLEKTIITYLTVPPSFSHELTSKKVNDPFISDPELFEGVLSCCKAIKKHRHPMFIDGCVRAAFGLIMEKMEFIQRETTAETDHLTPVLLYLHDNFRGDISLSSTAAALGFNSSYLSRSFKSALGIGFNRYLTMLRLREAVRLLADGNTAEFSAFESGFNSMRTFYRAFSGEFGCSPGEYIKT